jgi:hypothetical protein
MKSAKKKPVTRKRKITYIVLGSILLILIGLRIALPYILLKLVNRELTKIPGYTGHVDDLDVALIRGAYKLKHIKLDKTGGAIPVPFFSADVVDLSVQWNALFHGRFVGEIEIDHPTLNFVKGPTEATSQTKIDKSWTDVVKKLMPLKLNRFEVIDGEIHYRDYHSHPTFDIFAKNTHITAENLTNAEKNKELLPSRIAMTSSVYGGSADLTMKMDALNKTPTFDAKAKLLGLNIVNLNNFINAEAKFDVKKGEISIYTEAAAKNGKITGYAKPIIKDLKVLNWEKDKDKPLKIAYEAVVEAVAWVFKNHSKDQLATRAEFEGNIKNPDVDVWTIIGEVLRNAFIQALYPSLENSVNINSVDGQKDESKTDLSKAYDKSNKELGVKSKVKDKKEIKKEKKEKKKEEKKEAKEKKEKEKKAAEK